MLVNPWQPCICPLCAGRIQIGEAIPLETYIHYNETKEYIPPARSSTVLRCQSCPFELEWELVGLTLTIICAHKSDWEFDHRYQHDLLDVMVHACPYCAKAWTQPVKWKELTI